MHDLHQLASLIHFFRPQFVLCAVILPSTLSFEHESQCSLLMSVSVSTENSHKMKMFNLPIEFCYHRAWRFCQSQIVIATKFGEYIIL
jgi:hypothetical protein